MKKIAALFIIIAFSALYLNVFGQNNSPFQVTVSGKGNKFVVFIPGFASQFTSND